MTSESYLVAGGAGFIGSHLEIYGLETVCLRYFNVFGPRQDPNSPYAAVIPKFITYMLQGKPPIMHGDGLQSRDLTYVVDNVAANILVATATDVAGWVFNIACGRRYTLLDLANTLNDILDADITPIFAVSRLGDIRHSEADIEAAQTLLGYEPEIDFREGLEHTVGWYLEQVGI